MPPTPSSSNRVSWREVLLLFVAFTAGLALVDVALRTHDRLSDRSRLDDLTAAVVPAGTDATLGQLVRPSHDPKIVYQLQPSLDVRYRGVPVQTNAEGWREEEAVVPGERPGAFRIVGLGDSVMFGHGVPRADRYLDRLEIMLTPHAPDQRVESVALAVPGYNLAMEVAVLERFGLAYHPDLIVYGYVGNDHCLPSFVDQRRSFFEPIWFLRLYALRQRSHTTLIPRTRLEQPARAGRGQRRSERLGLCAPETLPPRHRTLAGRDRFVDALERLAAIGHQHDIPVVVFNFGRSTLDRAAHETGGLVVIDAHPRYQAHLRAHDFPNARASDLVLTTTDSHPSVLGHALAARWLTDGLLAAGLAIETTDSLAVE